MTGFDLSTISAVYVGDTSYSEIYLGSTKIWPAAQHDYSQDYLTLRSASDNNGIYFCWTDGGSSKTIDVSKDNGTTWTSYTSTAFIGPGSRGTLIARLNAGDKLLIKGLQQTYKKNHLTPSGITDISGNIMSLFYGDNFIGQTSFPSNNLTSVCAYMFNSDLFRHAKNLILPATTLTESCYEGMFSTSDLNPSQLLTAPTLPATTLAEQCYQDMFYNCTSLLTAPALPATTLADLCYHEMFMNCTSLTVAPELPATTLVQHCYHNMFYGCTSLTTAPALPATTLVRNCYSGMFMNCTSLTTPPALPANTLDNYCYLQMFEGCTSLTTAPVLPATNIYVKINEYIVACYYRMFSGCTSLTTAPELPATKLSSGCYREMFSGCTSLNSVTCHATNISATDCLYNWLDNVAATGDFYKDANTTYPTGASGIPSGWTIHNIAHDYSQDYLTFRILENGVIPWKANSTTKTIEYSLNNGTWTSITSTSAGVMINVSQGDTIRFRGNNTTYCASGNSRSYSGFGNGQGSGSYVTNAASFNVEGNIMSLIYGDNFVNQTTFNGSDYQFCSLFKKAKVVSAENLILPATTLTDSCYRAMFGNCSLLTTAPVLPVTELYNQCYYYMFQNCSSLNYIKCLATDISASNCTKYWTVNVASSGTFVKNSSMSSWTTGYDGIPSGWTVQDA